MIEQPQYIPITVSAIDREEPNRLPGFRAAIEKAGRKLMRASNRTEVAAYLLTPDDFLAIKTKYNPSDITGAAMLATLYDVPADEKKEKDVRVQLSKEMFALEKIPDIALTSLQLQGRAMYKKKLDGRSEAECASCDLNAAKVKSTRLLMDSADVVPTSLTIITLWRGHFTHALDWYRNESFPKGVSIQWVVNSRKVMPELLQYKEARPELNIRIQLASDDALPSESRPLKIAALYDQAVADAFLGDLVLTVGDDVKAPAGSLLRLQERFKHHTVGSVSAVYELGKAFKGAVNYSAAIPFVCTPMDAIPTAEVDITDGLATMGFHMWRKDIIVKSLPFSFTGRQQHYGNDHHLHVTAKQLGYKSYTLPDVVAEHFE